MDIGVQGLWQTEMLSLGLEVNVWGKWKDFFHWEELIALGDLGFFSCGEKHLSPSDFFNQFIKELTKMEFTIEAHT